MTNTVCHICGNSASWVCCGRELKECDKCRNDDDAKAMHWAAISNERKQMRKATGTREWYCVYRDCGTKDMTLGESARHILGTIHIVERVIGDD